jgi:hypothetical protein
VAKQTYGAHYTTFSLLLRTFAEAVGRLYHTIPQQDPELAACDGFDAHELGCDVNACGLNRVSVHTYDTELG